MKCINPTDPFTIARFHYRKSRNLNRIVYHRVQFSIVGRKLVYWFKWTDQLLDDMKSFLSDLQASTKISIASLLNHDGKVTLKILLKVISVMMKILFAIMLNLSLFLCTNTFIMMNCIQAGLTTTDGIDNDLESLYEGDTSLIPPPIINGVTALTFLKDLSYHLRSPISLLPSVPGIPGTILVVLSCGNIASTRMVDSSLVYRAPLPTPLLSS